MEFRAVESESRSGMDFQLRSQKNFSNSNSGLTFCLPMVTFYHKYA